MVWLVGKKDMKDTSGQAQQELGKGLGEREFGRKMDQEVGMQVTGKTGRWEVGGTQDVGRYVYPVREDRKENDVGEEKDVGKKDDTCTVEVFDYGIAGVEFQQKVGQYFECKDCWEYDEKVGSMKAGQAWFVGSQVVSDIPVVVQREYSGEVDMYVNEQKVDVEEGGATLEDKRGRRVGGMKKVGRYNDVDSGVEENDDEDEDVNVDAEG